MTKEAKLIDNGHGLVPEDGGWFVVNVSAAAWRRSPSFGSYCDFEGKQLFEQIGVNVHVIQPDQPSCMYHRETAQEDFLVLHGECIAIVEDEERRLGQWDFLHCPPGTNHVFVGAGDGPCAILAIGSRSLEESIVYPRSEVALARGAGVETETPLPREAYAGRPPTVDAAPAWPLEPRQDV